MLNDAESLLQEVKLLLDKDKSNEKSVADPFNIFSILGIERNENKTHSSLIRALLNPNGSHGQGSYFLDIFFEVVNYNYTSDKKFFVNDGEKFIGSINEDNTEGGRIDIYLFNSEGYTISIENKIDAYDQEKQILRYYNHNQEKNTVYYLTLYGTEASACSAQGLISGKDYHIISYQYHIRRWLEESLKKKNLPYKICSIVQQYFELIKNLTPRVNFNRMTPLHSKLLEQIDIAKEVSKNLIEARIALHTHIRNEVFQIISAELMNEFDVFLGKEVVYDYSQIWIKVKNREDNSIYFGLESFSIEEKKPDTLFTGWFSAKRFLDLKINTRNTFCENDWWKNTKKIEDFDGLACNLHDASLVKYIVSNEEVMNRFIKHIADLAIAYFRSEKQFLLEVLS
ncbi:MAG: PD-(D/E)XK nuclease family protein [Sediminibacterium sp. Gen4]|jgi:hypothetical protein|uniref:PDDEXK-like family protein n=1 Tax=unclassified Sediminibacterium TaxID=2635961 RepID=UPI0015BEB637|nr:MULTISPECIES: PD-(D/E)XK nuclease family protein [unclassified Sediminibacterium]MBW0161352.1 PD-(D/E)XK nuclease family protein [Sediminibacterium sp.]MBW0163281.1 PD-(D/E)XK nuclease family protein [Sediminibacterium sp.]NWK66178.1 PD-(D/E)XK nuclease family protein [Sediminibacterium sp. Gen4]